MAYTWNLFIVTAATLIRHDSEVVYLLNNIFVLVSITPFFLLPSLAFMVHD